MAQFSYQVLLVVHHIVLAFYIHGLYFTSGALLLKKTCKLASLTLSTGWAKDNTNISMNKRSFHDDSLKRINLYNAYCSLFYKSSKKK